MAFLGLDFSKNLSLYTVPAALVLAMTCHTIATTVLGLKFFDPGNPRKFESTVRGDDKVDKVNKNRILRAKAAADNGLETLGFYAAGVVAANVAKLDVATLNALSLGYIASRIVYYIVYIRLQDNRAFAPLRSIVWAVGLGLTATMYIKAASKLA